MTETWEIIGKLKSENITVSNFHSIQYRSIYSQRPIYCLNWATQKSIPTSWTYLSMFYSKNCIHFTKDIKMNCETVTILFKLFHYVFFTNHHENKHGASQNILLNLIQVLDLNSSDGSHKDIFHRVFKSSDTLWKICVHSVTFLRRGFMTSNRFSKGKLLSLKCLWTTARDISLLQC